MLLKVECFQLGSRYNPAQDIKILAPNKMLQTLLIALAQVKAGNTSEVLRKEIPQTISLSYRSNDFVRNIIKSI